MTVGSGHGGNLDQLACHYPNAPQPWLDLSTGISPWSYPVESACLSRAVHQLPSAAALEGCMEAMAFTFGCSTSAVLPTPGTELVIRLLPQLLPGALVVSPPTYGDYETAWRQTGAEVIAVGDVTAAPASAAAIVVCNPNNPDGRCLERATLESIYQQTLKRNQWLIVDEAYGELQPASSIADLAGSEKLIVLRSVGKFYGLPGLRLGALLGPSDVLDWYRGILGYWSVSSLALEVGQRLYRDKQWRDQHAQRLSAAARTTREGFARAGVALAGSTDLFFSFKPPEQKALWRSLMQNGIYTRLLDASCGLIRCGLPADEEDLERLLSTLRFDYHRYARN